MMTALTVTGRWAMTRTIAILRIPAWAHLTALWPSRRVVAARCAVRTFPVRAVRAVKAHAAVALLDAAWERAVTVLTVAIPVTPVAAMEAAALPGSIVARIAPGAVQMGRPVARAEVAHRPGRRVVETATA